jgi:hypothetical protein
MRLVGVLITYLDVESEKLIFYYGRNVGWFNMSVGVMNQIPE